MLAISQALITEPELLLLDEPSLGLAPQLVDEVFEVITTLSDEGVTVLVVEQQAKRALEATDRAYVMQGGEVEFEGQSSEILESDQLSESYLR
jgi:branched-chain amino acid transport system ATP-binding protein